MNVSSVHEIRLLKLDHARPVQPGDQVRVHLGDTWHVSSADAWTIRRLVHGARHVHLVGSTQAVRTWLQSVIEATAEADQ